MSNKMIESEAQATEQAITTDTDVLLSTILERQQTVSLAPSSLLLLLLLRITTEMMRRCTRIQTNCQIIHDTCVPHLRHGP